MFTNSYSAWGTSTPNGGFAPTLLTGRRPARIRRHVLSWFLHWEALILLWPSSCYNSISARLLARAVSTYIKLILPLPSTKLIVSSVTHQPDVACVLWTQVVLELHLPPSMLRLAKALTNRSAESGPVIVDGALLVWGGIAAGVMDWQFEWRRTFGKCFILSNFINVASNKVSSRQVNAVYVQTTIDVLWCND